MGLEELEVGFAGGVGGGLRDCVIALEDGERRAGEGDGRGRGPEDVVVVGEEGEEHAEEEGCCCY